MYKPEHGSNPNYNFALISSWFIINTILNFSGRIVLSKNGVGFRLNKKLVNYVFHFRFHGNPKTIKLLIFITFSCFF